MAFVIALALIVLSGPLLKWNETWLTWVNTGTQLATFFLVFLVQNTQNRDTEAMQLKLDELIRSTKGAHTALLDLEELTEEELDRIRDEFLKLAEKSRAELRRGKGDTGTPDVG